MKYNKIDKIYKLKLTIKEKELITICDVLERERDLLANSGHDKLYKEYDKLLEKFSAILCD